MKVYMENTINRISDIVKIGWIILVSVFAPIGASIYTMSVFFVINFFVGFQTDRIVNNAGFNLDKIKNGSMLFMLYFAILFIINVSMDLYGEDRLALTIPKFFTWIACYWYLVNIFRNAKLVFPESEGLIFMYNVLTIQVLDMIFARFGIKLKGNTDEESEEEDHK